MHATIAPKVSTVVTVGTLADMTTYAVNVTYPGETPRRVMFTGMRGSSGPVVMSCPTYPRGIFVDDPDRFGPFGPDWVARFYA